MEIKDYFHVLHNKGSDKCVLQPTREDVSGNIQYFLYVNEEGGWIIQKIDRSVSPATETYISGTANATAAWAVRASLSYVEYNALFPTHA